MMCSNIYDLDSRISRVPAAVMSWALLRIWEILRILVDVRIVFTIEICTGIAFVPHRVCNTIPYR